MLVIVLRAALAALLLTTPPLAAMPARAAESCPALFADGRPPVLVDPKLAPGTVALCFEAFAVLHSAAARTPLYAAEHLTRASIAEARTVARDDAFHEERRLPDATRASLSDYLRSGYDRGHMAPAADMPSLSAQAQSFSLANIVPQDRAMNRGLWSDIEEGVRRLAGRRGALYVVTGPIFAGASVQAIGSGVLVPTQLFKAVYDPGTGEAGAYLVPNADAKDWRAVSIEALQAAAGVDVFPGLPPAARTTAMALPDPGTLSRGEAARPRSEQGWSEWIGRELARAVRRIVRDILRTIF